MWDQAKRECYVGGTASRDTNLDRIAWYCGNSGRTLLFLITVACGAGASSAIGKGASRSYASATDRGGGSIQAALGVQTEHYGCAIPRDLEALVLNPWLAGYAQLLAQTGEVLLRSSMVGAPHCTFQQLPVGVVRGLDTAPCQQSVNPRVLLDEAQLVGQNLCLELL